LKKLTAVVFALLMMVAAGVAQIPTAGNVFFGYSYNRADTGENNRGNLNGWEGSVEGKVFPFVGMVADFSEHYGTLNVPVVVTPLFSGSTSVSTHVQSYLFGPRVSFSVGKMRPFAHVLIGAARDHEGVSGISYSETDFADAIGGGIDYRLVPFLGWRIQGDALQTRFHGSRQNDARISTGLVFRF